jgi:uncharacterized protein involved in exopolysaccharide biosynthesis
METRREESITLGDLLGKLGRFLKFVIGRWWQVGIAVILGAAIGLGLYFLQKPKYEADCSFILEERQQGLGGLSGIASQFGLDLGGMTGGGGMFSGDNIFEILQSKIILKKVLLDSVVYQGRPVKLADLYLGLSGLKDQWAGNQKLDTVQFSKVGGLPALSLMQDSVLNIIYAQILKKHLTVERVSKKGTIIKATVVSEEPVFSKALVQGIVQASREYYIAMKTAVTSANVQRLQQKADSLLNLLSGKTYSVAQSQYNDPNPALRILLVPAEIGSRDKTVLSTLYTEVVKNLEISKTTLMMQTPVLQILDTPSLSLKDNRKGKLFFLAAGGFLMAAVFCLLLLVRFSKQESGATGGINSSTT